MRGTFPAKYAVFARELISRKKVFQGRFRRYLFDSQDIRNEADYKNAMVSKKTADRQLRKSVEFIMAIKEELKNANP